MKTTVNLYQFRDAFRSMGRENFSYDGLGILFAYMEELESSCGEEWELDVVALCCDYAEDTPKDIAESYGITLTDPDDAETTLDEVWDYLEDRASVCGVTDDGDIVYQQF